jgi:hypothetical protein
MGQYYSRYYDASGTAAAVAPAYDVASSGSLSAHPLDVSAAPVAPVAVAPVAVAPAAPGVEVISAPSASQPIAIPAPAASQPNTKESDDSDSTPASSANTTPSNSFQQSGQHITKSAKRRAKKLAALQAAAASKVKKH